MNGWSILAHGKDLVDAALVYLHVSTQARLHYGDGTQCNKLENWFMAGSDWPISCFDFSSPPDTFRANIPKNIPK